MSSTERDLDGPDDRGMTVHDTIADRWAQLQRTKEFVDATVSPVRLALDALVVAVIGALGLVASTSGQPITQYVALASVVVFAVVRIRSAWRAAETVVAGMRRALQPLRANQRAELPPELMTPADVLTLTELDAVVRQLHPALRLRVTPWIGLAFWVLTFGSMTAAIVVLVNHQLTSLPAALLGIAMAAAVSLWVWSIVAWANQRLIDETFRQADPVIDASDLFPTDLPADAAIAVDPEGKVVLVRERLPRHHRPRTRTAPRPPLAPGAVILGTGVLSAVLTLLRNGS